MKHASEIERVTNERDKARKQRDAYKALLKIADDNAEQARIRNAELCRQLRELENRIFDMGEN